MGCLKGWRLDERMRRLLAKSMAIEKDCGGERRKVLVELLGKVLFELLRGK